VYRTNPHPAVKGGLLCANSTMTIFTVIQYELLLSKTSQAPSLLTLFNASQYYAFFLSAGNIDPPFIPSDLEADFMIVLITFRRAMISSAIINITTALISVVIFFFTSNAPSMNPAFIFLYHLSIYKDEVREDFYFSFHKNILKKSKNLIFRLLKAINSGRMKFFLRESRPVVSDVGLIRFQVCPVPAFRTPVEARIF